jgi:putative ABC transport system permease protein
MIAGQGIKLALIRVAIGLAAALGVIRFIASQHYGVSLTDPFTYAAVSIGLIAVAGVASYVPARRAARVDRKVALRTE